jgi:hypothetical protein
MSGHISLVTQQHSPKLANPINAVAATVLVTRYSSATPTVTASASYARPTTITATSADTTKAGGALVVPGGMNYLKIMPLWLTGTSGLSPTIRVIGWSYSKDANVWVSSLICNIACTVAGAAIGTVVVAGANLLPSTTLTNSIGDAKIFNATALACNAFFVVDTLGFEQIELCFQVSSGTFTCNAFVSEI